MAVINTHWHIVSVALVAVALVLLATACSGRQAAPTPAEIDLAAVREVVEEAVAASSSETASAEEIRAMVEAAVADATSQGVAPEQIRRIVEDAVASASEQNRGTLAEELEAQVAKSVSEALTDLNASDGTDEEPSSFVLTDVAGRTVTINRPVERILLFEGRQLYVVAGLQPGNPFDKIVGWGGDLKGLDVDAYEKYKEKFPEIDDIADFGFGGSVEDFSVEWAIDLEVDVITLDLDGLRPAQETGMVEQLAEAGIPIVVIDYRHEPLENTVPSTYILGRLFDQQERAQEIVDFYLQQVNVVYSRVGQLETEKPLVFLDIAGGFEGAENCCLSNGRGNLGLMVERAGGINLGSELVPGVFGMVNAEEILVSRPDVIVATGGNAPPYNTYGDLVTLGYFSQPDEARSTLARLGEGRPGWSELPAINNGRHHAVWHNFYNSPYHFAALQQFAKWFHPELFEDIDPVANLAEYHERFLPIGYSGTFMVSAE
ncbi:MAG: ABC transporter substrate-binding protein [Chloroflexota bacterium]|nr:ABC transporter substrate-binding protein [Chloroflexota bacterium]